MNLIILGPAGSGKGTQAEKLSERFDLIHIDMGKILRRLAQMDTPLGRETNEIVNIKRELVPTRIAREVLKLELGSVPRERGVVFDGVPRNEEQRQYIEEEIRNFGRKIDKVFYVDISAETSAERITKRVVCQKCKAGFILGRDIESLEERCPFCEGEIVRRKDDTPEGVKKRLAVFKAETSPILEEYEKQGVLVKIDGEGEIEEVFKKIISNF
ncbi:MAG: adenylate kinase family protein [Patescibacteria group bacterium]